MVVANNKLTKLSLAIKVSLALMAGSVVLLAQAGPEGGAVVAGSGSIAVNGNTTTIDQLSDRLALDWQSFDISAEQLVKFNQPGSNAIALNRILSNNPTTIMGMIEANGRVVLVNPSGILFTESSQVNVNALIASGLNITVDDFMNSNLLFSAVEGAKGLVINRGLINASTSVSLLGHGVANEGAGAFIQAELVSLNAASEALLTFDSAGMIGVKVDKAVLQNSAGLESAVSNSGEINAGSVLLGADVAAGLFDRAVNNEGVVAASGIDTSGGTIRLSGRGGDTYNSGVLDARSVNSEGGKVVLEGDRVALLGNSVIDASGGSGGGEVLVGGDYQGLNAEVSNAAAVYMGADAIINANATVSGDGGKVVLWADGATQFFGRIDASAAGLGAGGFVETSGLQGLMVNGEVNVSASGGAGGHWLLDPDDLTVSVAADDNLDTDPFESSNSDPANLSVASLLGALSGDGVTVTIQSTAGGDITFADSIDFSTTGTGNTLAVDSDSDIFVDAGIALDANGNAINFDLLADDSISLGAGASIVSSGGSFTADATQFSNLGTVDAGAGLLVIDVSGNVSHSLGTLVSSNAGGTVTGDNGAQVFSLGAASNFAGSIDGSGGGDNFVIESGAVLGGGIDGGGGNDTVTGADGSSHSFSLGAANSIDGIVISNVEAYSGGDGADTFTLDSTASGSIDGAGGSDEVIGADGEAHAFVLGVADSIDGITVDNFEVFTGGDGVDTFTLEASAAGAIDGAGNTDEVIGDDGADHNFTVSLSAGVADAVSVVDIENYSGGDGADNFTIASDAGTGVIAAGAGSDEVIGANGATHSFSLSASANSVDGLTATGFESYVGGDGVDTFTLSSTATGSIDGAAGSDELIGADGEAHAFVLGVADSIDSITVDNFEVFTGGDGVDTFTLEASAAGAIDGAGNADEVMGDDGADHNFTVSLSAGVADAVSVVNIENYSGGDGADNFIIASDAGTGVIAGGAGSDTVTGADGSSHSFLLSAASNSVDGLTASGFEFYSGGDAADTFTVGSGAAGSIDGGADTDEVVGANGAGHSFTVSLAAGAADAVNVVNVENYSGGDDVDNFTIASDAGTGVIAAGAGTDAVMGVNGVAHSFNLAASGNTVDGLTATGFESYIGGDAADTFTLASTATGSIDGAAGSDQVIGTDGEAHSFVLGVSDSVDGITLSNIEAFIGGDSADSFTVGTGAAGTIDGVGGSDQVLGADGQSHVFVLGDSDSINGISLTNIESFTGGNGADQFTLASSEAGAVDGAGGTDTIIGADGESHDFVLAASDSINGLTVANFEVFTGADGADSFTVGAGATGAIDGAGSSDEVVGVDGVSHAVTASATAGAFDAVSVVNVENYSGGDGADNFTVASDAGTGVIAAGAGVDTVAGANGSAHSFNLSAAGNSVDGLTATGFEVYTGGDAGDTFTLASTATGSIDGAAGSDEVIGADGEVHNFILGVSDSIDGIALANIEVFSGGDGADSFTLQASAAGAIDGGSNTDEVIGADGLAHSFTVSLAAGAADAVSVINVENYSGGDGADSFTVASDAGTGVIAAGAGVDAVIGANGVAHSFNLSAGSNTVDGLTATGFESYTGGDAGDTFTLATTVTGSIDGAAGSDQVIGADGEAHSFILGVSDSIDGIALANIEAFSGGDGADSFSIQAGAAGAIDGAGNTDEVVGADGLAHSFTVSLAAGAADAVSVINVENYSGGDGADSFTVGSDAGTGVIAAGAGVDAVIGANGSTHNFNLSAGSNTVDGLTVSGFESYAGGNAADTFTLASTATGSIDGAAGSDEVIGVDGEAHSFVVGAASSIDGISLSNIEAFTGGDDADSFTVQAGASGAIDGAANTDTVIGADGLDHSFTVSASAGAADAVSVINVENYSGGDGADSFTVASDAGTGVIAAGAGIDAVAGANGTAHSFNLSAGSNTVDGLTATGFESYTGGDAGDTFTLASTAIGSIDGAGGSDQVIGADGEAHNFILGVSDSIDGIALANIEAFTGGDGADSFSIQTGAAGAIDGAGNTDEVIGADGLAHNFIVSQASGAVDAVSVVNVENYSGGDGADSFTVASDAGTGVIAAGAGVDAVIGANGSAHSFNVSAGSNTVDGLTASGFESYTGGDASDTFTLASTAIGSIDGAAGSDTVIGADGEGHVFIIGAASSMDGISLSNIEAFTGGDGVDSFTVQAGASGAIDGAANTDAVIGADGLDHSFIVSASAGAADALSVVNVENYTGGDGADSFTLAADALGTIDGGANTDEVIGADGLDHSFTVSLAAGTANAVSVINVENYSGGDGTDTFTVASDAGTGVIAAGAGVDAVIGANGSAHSFNLSGAGNSVDGLTATGFEVYTGGDVGDTFTLASTATGSIDGAAGSDQVIGADGEGHNFILGVSDSIDGIALANIEVFSGGDGADSFSIQAGAVGVIDGAGNTDEVIGADGLDHNFIVSQGAGAADAVSVINVENYSGGDGADSFTLASDAGTGVIAAGAGVDAVIGANGVAHSFNLSAGTNTIDGLTASGFESYTGGDAADSFTLASTATGSIDGAAGSDTVIGADGEGHDFIVGAVSSIDSISLSNIEAFTGGDGADSFTVQAGASGAIDGAANTDTVIGADGLDHSFIVSASAGAADAVSVVNVENYTGADGADTFTLAADALGAIDGGANIDEVIGADGLGHSFTVSLAAGAADAVSVINVENYSGGDGADTFTVASDAGTGEIAAGAGIDAVIGANGVAHNFNLSAGSNTVDGLTATGFESYTGGDAGDTFTLASTVTGSIDGAAGSDQVIGADGEAHSFILGTSDSIDGISLASFEVFSGGDGVDSFTLQAGAAGAIDGAGNTDEVIAADGLAHSFIVSQAAGAVDAVSVVNVENYSGGAGADIFTVASDAGTGVIAAGAGVDAVIGANGSAHSFNVGAGSNTVDGLTATGFESYTGGDAADSFTLASTATGSIDGAAGSDTVIGADGEGHDFIIGAASSMDGISLSNIEAFIGGDGTDSFTVQAGAGGAIDGAANSDTVIGADGLDHSFIVSASAGALDALSVVNVENYIGADGADSFTLAADALGTIDGGANTDEVIGADGLDHSFTVSLAAGAVNAVSVINVENYSGADGADTFTVASDAGTGVIAAGAGVDAVIGANGSAHSFNLSAAGNSIDGLTATGFESYTGGDAADSFTLSSTATGNIDGAVGSDTVIGADGEGHDFIIGGASSIDGISLSNIEVFTGGDGADSFTVQAGAAGAVDGGANNDEVIGANGLTHSFVVSASAGAADAVSVVNVENYSGGDGADTFMVASDAGTGVIAAGAGVDAVIGANGVAHSFNLSAAGNSVDGLTASGFESYTGGDAADTFTLASTATGSMDGAAGSDTVIGADGEGHDFIIGVASSMDGISLSNIEAFTGADGADSFTVQAGASGAIDGAANTDAVIGADGLDHSFIVSASAGAADALSVVNVENYTGADGADSFTLAADALGTIDGGANTDEVIGADGLGHSFTVSLAAGAADAVSVINVENYSGGDGADTFTIASDAGTGVIAAGAGVDAVIGANGSAHSFNLSGAGNSVDGLTATGFESYIGGDAADTFTLASTATGSIDGAAGSDTVIGADGEGHSFILGVSDSIDGISLASFEVFNGGDGADSFTVLAGATGAVDGAGNTDQVVGANGLDHSFIVSLTAGAADAVSVVNVENYSGGDGNDSFVLADSAAADIDGAAGLDEIVAADGADHEFVLGLSDSIDGLGVSNFEVFTGGDGADSFTVSSTETGFINGAAGNDLVVGAGGENHVFIVDAVTSIDGVVLTGIEDYQGAEGNDSFALNSGVVGQLSGGGGDDLFVLAGASFNSIDGGEGAEIDGDRIAGGSIYQINTKDGGTVDGALFSHIENLTGSMADDLFTLAGGSLSGAIDGAGGSGDSFVAGDGSDHAFSFTGDNAATVDGIDVTNVENYRGGDGDDSFVFDGDLTVAGVIDGAGGGDRFVIDSRVTSTLLGGGGDDLFSLGSQALLASLDGGAGNDLAVFNGAQSSWDFSASEPLLNQIRLRQFEQFDDQASLSTVVTSTGDAVLNSMAGIELGAGRVLLYQAGGDLTLSAGRLTVESLSRDGRVSLIASAIDGGGSINSQDLQLSSLAEVALGDISAAALEISAGGIVDVLSVASDSLLVQQAAGLQLAQLVTGSAAIQSAGGVVVQGLQVGDITIEDVASVSLNGDITGALSVNGSLGDITINDAGDLQIGNLNTMADNAVIDVVVQRNVLFATIATQSRSNGRVSIRSAAGDIVAGRSLEQAVNGQADIVAGMINLESALGKVGQFQRPLIVNSTTAASLLNLQPFVNGKGLTPTPVVSGGVLGSSALDVASSSGLSSAVQTLLDTLAEIDPGVFKNDSLVERDETALALPESQRLE